MTERLWPNGMVSGFCLVGGDHGRCLMAHVADPNCRGCHCPVCVAAEAAPEPELVDVELDTTPAVASQAAQSDATAGTADGATVVLRLLDDALDALREPREDGDDEGVGAPDWLSIESATSAVQQARDLLAAEQAA